MAPTNAEIIGWIVLAIISLGFLAYAFFHKDYVIDRNDDPYRYCPKDEEEW